MQIQMQQLSVLYNQRISELLESRPQCIDSYQIDCNQVGGLMLSLAECRAKLETNNITIISSFLIRQSINLQRMTNLTGLISKITMNS